MKVLVIGGAGFIGSNLCEELISKGFQVISIDNYFTGDKKNHVKNVKYIKANSSTIEQLGLTDVRVIYHLGEYSRVEQSLNEIDKVWEMNIIPMKNILNFAVSQKAKLIYAASSTRFYNNNQGEKLTPYTFSKFFNLELIKNFSNWYGLEYAITYFYNVYGPNEISDGKYSTLIAKFIKQYKQKQPLTVVKPGTQKRHFTHVKDIVSGLLLIGERGNGDGYGIGGSDYFSVLDVAKIFKTEIKFLQERKGNRLTSSLNINKTLELGWSQKYTLENYIKEVKSSIN